jgi:hypothetical protein
METGKSKLDAAVVDARDYVEVSERTVWNALVLLRASRTAAKFTP